MMATHAIKLAKSRESLCGIVGPRYWTHDRAKVDCLRCRRVLKKAKK